MATQVAMGIDSSGQAACVGAINLVAYVIIEPLAPRGARQTDRRLAARVAATASLGVALIHFAVLPAHWREWLPSGVFFALVAAFQLAWAFVVWVRPLPPVLAAGIVANLGSVALWGLSRIVGVPFGPHAGEPEVVRAAGICALLLQSYVVL